MNASTPTVADTPIEASSLYATSSEASHPSSSPDAPDDTGAEKRAMEAGIANSWQSDTHRALNQHACHQRDLKHPAFKLEGRVAVITGGARGIGLAIATRYVQEGASVALADIDGKAAHRAAVALREQEGSQARVLAVTLDVTSRVSRQSMIECVQAQLGPIDILVNNAAVFDMAPVLEVSEGMMHTALAVNVEGLFFTLQAVARTMVERGQGGRIINMASQAGRRGEALVSTYCASKSAVISLTQSCGLDLIKHGINVNGIAPGVVDTPMWDEVDALFARYEHRAPGEKKRLVAEAVPYGRMGLPQDHAGAAVFLACEDSDFVVAQTLNVDGGNWMS